MTDQKSPIVANRYDAVLLFDVTDGNPNGDPDAGNLPRMDPETGHGIVTDVCLKRKVRNFIGIAKGENPPYEIYVKEKAVLNRAHERAYEATGAEFKGKEGKKSPKGPEAERQITEWICHNFFDIRTFGAVMTTDINAGQVRGPVQLSFARSIDPIMPVTHSITRCAVTNERDLEKERTMGDKHTVPYGLYRAHVFVSPHFASKTGFDEEDLALLWQALTMMFDHDRAATRGQMNCRGLYLFRHESPLGNAPSHELLDRITVQRREGVSAPRRFTDYEVLVNDQDIPAGVELVPQLEARPSADPARAVR